MATLYKNGLVPMSALVQIDGEPYHYTSPKGLAMWHALKRNVQRDHNVTLHITAGKNAYRDMAGQQYARTQACNNGNCYAAAWPGTSSHGGTWTSQKHTGGREIDAMAFDIGDWAEIGKEAFFAEARAVGFAVDQIEPEESGGIREPWHIIVLDPWGPVPASLTATAFDPAQREEEDEEMARAGFQFKTTDGKLASLVLDTTSGFYHEWYSNGATYNTNVFAGFGIDMKDVQQITKLHRDALLKDSKATRG